MILTIVTIVLLFAYGRLFLFYKKGWEQLEEVNSSADFSDSDAPYISVIVAARNEEKVIGNLLAALEDQNYPVEKFEVLVVNDHSTDRTAEIISSFSKTRLIEATDSHSGKKQALSLAIQNAKGELIVATDADCLPGRLWLSILAQFYLNTKAAFIAAPVMYKNDNSLLSVFQTIDFITLQGITAAGVSTGVHSMCNGANLAYEKQAFEKVNGFEGIDKPASGDDLLLMHKISSAYPGQVHYLKSKAATVITIPPQTWKEFYWQRIRWASKTNHYQDKKIYYALLLVLAINVLFFALLIAAFKNPVYWFLIFFYWIAKTVVEASFIRPVAKFYGQEKLLNWFFILQPLHILYIAFVGMLSQFGSYRWKGRRTK